MFSIFTKKVGNDFQKHPSEELKGKTTDVQNWKKMSYDIFMVGKINLNSLVKTELRYSNF